MAQFQDMNPQQLYGLLGMQAAASGRQGPSLGETTKYLGLLDQQGQAKEDRSYLLQQRQRTQMMQGRADETYALGQAKLDPASQVSHEAREYVAQLYPSMDVTGMSAADLATRVPQIAAKIKADETKVERERQHKETLAATTSLAKYREDTLAQKDKDAIAKAAVALAKPAAEIKLAEEKDTVKKNSARLSSLNDSAANRNMSIDKAQYFLDKFESGEMLSGRAREALNIEGPFGLKLPVFTQQGRDDELLDSFAEVAARAKLKALGEIRPTDADVKGMKASMFGIGRDEETNIQLLTEFIAESKAGNAEHAALKEASRANTLGTFIYEAAPLLQGNDTVGGAVATATRTRAQIVADIEAKKAAAK